MNRHSFKCIIFIIMVMIAVNSFAAGVIQLPNTGQTTCFNAAGTGIPCSGSGQDGDVQAGAAWPEPRFIDNGNGTITDDLTGLIWLKNANCYTPLNFDTSIIAANELANGKCGLLDGSVAGDWRLPNVVELESLIVHAGLSDSTDWLTAQGFTDVGEKYWSSTSSYSLNRKYDAAMVVTMTGAVYRLDKEANISTYHWPVRGQPTQTWKTGQTTCYSYWGPTIDCANTGQDGDIQAGVEWPAPRFSDNGDGTVTDNLTGLIWLKDADCSSSMTWDNALTYSSNLANGSCGLTDASVAGDWRLPNRKELLSLIDFGEYSPALPPGHPFTDVQAGFSGYWSSTTSLSSTNHAVIVYMFSGDVSSWPKTSTEFVWPVRGVSGGTPSCKDSDGDGYGSPGHASCRNGSATDCDDSDNTVYPGANEVCDGQDNDCDTNADEGCGIADECTTGSSYYYDCNMSCFGPLQEYYDNGHCESNLNCAEFDFDGGDCITCIDLDGDGYGSPGHASCRNGGATDCDNNDNSVYPGANEVCDGKDNDCDSTVDESCGIGDSCRPQPYYDFYDCEMNCFGPGFPTSYMGDGFCHSNLNCAEFDFDGGDCVSTCTDTDGDGYGSPGHASCRNGGATDCDDSSNAAYPGAPELCDGTDNNCNGLADECNTPPSNTPVVIEDPTTGVTITFPDVTSGGETTITEVDCTQFSQGLVLPQNDPLCIEVTTDATSSQLIEVCMPYDDSNCSGYPEGSAAREDCERDLKVWRFDEGSAMPEELDKISQDIENNEVCVLTAHFSLLVQAIDCIHSDNDGICDVIDNCPTIDNGPGQMFIPGVGNQTDSDSDNVGDACDNCREVKNENQTDSNYPGDDNTAMEGIQHYGNACDADYSNNGFVGLEDFNELRTWFGKAVPPAPAYIDCDNDNFIGLSDFNCLRTYFGKAPGPGIE